MKLTVYTTPSCTYCVELKNWLDKEGLSYVEKDVSTDKDAFLKMEELTASKAVPVTRIETDKGSQTILGFNAPEFAAIIKDYRN